MKLLSLLFIIFFAQNESNSDNGIKYLCDKPYVDYGPRSKVYKRDRSSWSVKDKATTKKLAKMVAKEMGADYRLLLIWMQRGSETNAQAIHVLSPDIKAHKKAWKKYYWTQKKEDFYRKQMSVYSPDKKEYWIYKNKLSKILTYKDNIFFESFMKIKKFFKNKYIGEEKINYFHYGYGPYDMNSIFYLKRWSSTSPPWIMCNDYGLKAHIVAIWAARDFQKKCKSSGVGDSYGIIDRTYARGHCRKPNKDFIQRAKRYRLNPHQRARLGKKYPEKTTDRNYIYNYMLFRAKKLGIL